MATRETDRAYVSILRLVSVNAHTEVAEWRDGINAHLLEAFVQADRDHDRLVTEWPAEYRNLFSKPVVVEMSIDEGKAVVERLVGPNFGTGYSGVVKFQGNHYMVVVRFQYCG